MRKSITKLMLGIIAAMLIVTVFPAMNAKAATTQTVSIAACQINADRATVTVIGTTANIPTSDDGMMYLFAEPAYSTGITTMPIAACALSATPTFLTDLLEGTVNSRLYSKFCIGVPSGGKYVQVSNFCYLTNPQILSVLPAIRTVTTTKKGLFPDPLRMEQVVATGAQHTSYNLDISTLIGPGVNYVYNGKAYSFNGATLSQYDAICSYCKNNNISMTMVLVCKAVPGLDFLINPLARPSYTKASTYCMMNASEPAGVEYLAAICAFLAERYNGWNGCGQIDNFVIGNEVSAFVQWNYVPAGTPLATYVDEYSKVLRVAYNAIKSKNSSAKVFTSCDQMYNRNSKYNFCYDVRDFLESLAAKTSGEGNFSWGVSIHPYNCPLTTTTWWNNTKYYNNLIKHNQNTAYITIQNIDVFTDFMCGANMLTPAGAVRPIIIDEIGYSSSQGAKNQAAAIVYAYQQILNNQYIESFVYHNTTDIPAEVAQGLAEGILDVNGTPKEAYTWFTGMDGANGAAYTAAAMQVIGSQWNIIPR